MVRIDWIFIDTIIIILLILLLVGVKFFKSTHRWRVNFSNIALEYHPFIKTQEQVTSGVLSTKYWDLTKNLSLQDKDTDNKVIIILRTLFKKKLVRILTEGLSSYGFIVITIRIKIKHDLEPKISTKTITDEFQPLISSIISKSEQKGLISSPNYILLNFSDSLFLNNAIFSDSKNIGLILLNPKMSKSNVGIHQEISSSHQQEPQIFYIFSKRNFFIFKNKKLKQYKKYFEEKNAKKVELTILDKSNRYFKYYETILLGLLIDIIERKLIKSNNNN
jgi:hypothetical protein